MTVPINPNDTSTAEANTDIADRINIWKNAEVWVSDDPNAQVEADGSFGDDWKHVGILNDGSSIGQERDADRNETSGWGGQLLATESKFKKDSRTFDALEDTEVTFALMYPNSSYNNGGATVVMAPEDARKVIAFKTTNQNRKALIEVSRLPANIYPSSMDKNDDGASSTEFTAEIRKDSKGALYDRMEVVEDAEGVTATVIRFKTDDAQNPGGEGDNGGDTEQPDGALRASDTTLASENTLPSKG